VDFDEKTWKQDSRAFLEAGQELSMPEALAHSRSGKGGLVWIFSDHALAATDARKLGCGLRARTNELGINAVLIPTIGSFRTKTRCLR
jgi:hypothetical protein